MYPEFNREPINILEAGDVGYIILNIKDVSKIKVGDTVKVGFDPIKCHLFDNSNKSFS